MFNINGPEILFIAVLFLILFGPDRLPAVVVDLMNVVRQLRAAAESATEDLTREFQAAARDVRDVGRTVAEAGQDARRLVEETGAEARRGLEEAVGDERRIAPPELAAPDEGEGPPATEGPGARSTNDDPEPRP